jgi:hypothetical protein
MPLAFTRIHCPSVSIVETLYNANWAVDNVLTLPLGAIK